MKKEIHKIVLVFFSFLLSVACGQKEQIPDYEQETRMIINLNAGEVNTSTITKSSGLDTREIEWNTWEYENTINNASIFIFQDDPSLSDEDMPCLMRFVNVPCRKKEEGKFSVSVILLNKELKKFDPSKAYKIFVVANEDMTEFENIPLGDLTLARIKKHEIENNFDNFSLFKYLTMFGTGKLTFQDGAIKSSVELMREANKVTLYVRKGEKLVDSEIDSISVSLRDAVKRCRIDAAYNPQEEDFYNSPYKKCFMDSSGNEEVSEGLSYKFRSLNYFSYAKISNEEFRRAELHFIVTWNDKTESKFRVNVSDNIILSKNTWYKVFVTVNTKGGGTAPIVVQPDKVQVLDWTQSKLIDGMLGDGEEEYLEVLNKKVTSLEGKTVTFKYKSSSSLLKDSSSGTNDNIEIVKLEYMPLNHTRSLVKKEERKEITGEEFIKIKSKYIIEKIEETETADEGIKGHFSIRMVVQPDVDEKYFYTRRFVTIRLRTESKKVGLESFAEIEVKPYIEVDVYNSDKRSIFVNGWRFPDSDDQEDMKNNVDQSYDVRKNKSINHGWIGIFAHHYTNYVYTPYGYITRPYPSKHRGQNSPLDWLKVTEKLVNISSYSLKNYDNYYIGNPIVKSGWTKKNLIPWGVREPMVGWDNVNWSQLEVSEEFKPHIWHSASNIKIGSTSSEDFRQIAAPSFLVSSLYSEVGDDETTNYKIAQKRAATYQEAGYPGGRWRLPTEAEMRLIFKIQSNQELRNDFFHGKYILEKKRQYFMADKRCCYWDDDGGSPVFYIAGGNIDFKAHSKFVYDTWIWGNAPVCVGEDIYKYSSSGN